MDKETLLSKRKELARIKEEQEAEHNRNLNKINGEYARSNSTVKVGDVIEDHIGLLRVESILVGLPRTRPPECVYRGVSLTTTGRPKKKNPFRDVWQGNLLVLMNVNNIS